MKSIVLKHTRTRTPYMHRVLYIPVPSRSRACHAHVHVRHLGGRRREEEFEVVGPEVGVVPQNFQCACAPYAQPPHSLYIAYHSTKINVTPTRYSPACYVDTTDSS